MEGLPWRLKFCVPLFLSLTLVTGQAYKHENPARRQFYSAASPGILPAPEVGPAPVILPSGIVPAAGAVAPAPVILPAPAILPANAIKEKHRAYRATEGKDRRFQVPYNSNQLSSPWTLSQGSMTEGQIPLVQSPMSSQQAVPYTSNNVVAETPVQLVPSQMGSSTTTVPIVPNEMFTDTTGNRDQLSPAGLSFLQGQLSSGNSQKANSNLEYFEPGFSQDPSNELNGKQGENGPTQVEMDDIKPFIESDNKLAQAIINDTWAQDKELTTSRQALSEGLATSHLLANTNLKNNPLVTEKPTKKISNSASQNTTTFSEKNKNHTSPTPPQLDETTSLKANSSIRVNLTSTLHSDKPNNVSKLLSKVKEPAPSAKPQNLTAVILEKLVKDVLNSSMTDSANDWFSAAKLLLSNSSKENTTISGSTSKGTDKPVLKPFTAADYLQTLYPQLSIFQAPFKVDDAHSSVALSSGEKVPLPTAKSLQLLPSALVSLLLSSSSTSSSSSSSSSNPSSKSLVADKSHLSSSSSPPPEQIPSQSTNKTLKTLSRLPLWKLDTIAALSELKQDSLTSIKSSPKIKKKLQEAMLKALLKNLPSASGTSANVTLSANAHIQKYVSSLPSTLITRNKNHGKDKPGYRHLTEAGAKLLPGHIFSPLGTDFSDGPEPTPVPSPAAAIPTSASTTKPSKTETESPAVQPTQTGRIPAGTTKGAVASSTPPVVPTQEGMIQTVSKGATIPTSASPTKPTKTETESPAVQPTQAGRIPAGTTKGAVASRAPPVVPTQERMIQTVSKGADQMQTEVVTETPSDNLHDAPVTTKMVTSPTVPTKLTSQMPTKVFLEPTQTGHISTHPQTPKTTLPTKTPYVPTQNGYIPSNAAVERKDRKRADVNALKSKVIKTKSLHNSGAFNSDEKRRGSSRSHERTRRQMFLPVPLMQTNSNPQQFAQPLIPAQQLLPNLVQAQQTAQQFVPTQPLQPYVPQVALPADPMAPFVQPDLRSQLPLQQALNQPLFTAQAQDSLVPLASVPASPMAAYNQMSKTMGNNQYQQLIPERMSQNIPSYPRNDMKSIVPASLSPVTVNVPLPPPNRIPSFLAASEVYRDFQDMNSRSHLEDEILGGPVSRGETQYTPEDDLKDEQKYNNFVLENDKKTWDLDNDLTGEQEDDMPGTERKGGGFSYNSDEINDNSLEEQGDFDEPHPSSVLRYVSGGRRHHHPKRHRHRQQWMDEEDYERVNGKGIISHKDEKISEINDGEFHPADETTENAIKDSSNSYKAASHSERDEERPISLDEDLEKDATEKTSSTETTGTFQSEQDTGNDQSESNDSEGNTGTNQSESSNEENRSDESPSDDKSERHDELRDGLEETTEEVDNAVASVTPSIALPKPADSRSTSWKDQLVKKLSRNAVMHLNFDDPHIKPGDETVQDESGNKNDAMLANGAQISNRTMGTCGHVAILKEGEVMYKAGKFARKPTKAASIAMWVKSRKPGLVRWFDAGDNAEASPQKSIGSGKLVKVPRNQWIHLTGTFDSMTGVARVYVNGRLISETVGQRNQGLPDDFTATGIGKKFGDQFIAFLDDVYMFDRVISPTEVKILYKKCEFNRMILHFGFQNVNTTTHQVMDQSGLDNNGTIQGGAHTLNSGCDKCGACLDASSGKSPGVLIDGRRFHHKPTSAISVSSWISLNKTKGRHSIFQVVSNKNDEWHEIYILEVIDGKLHWGNKNSKGDRIFEVETEDVAIPEGLWSHVTATYSSETGKAKLFVNGLFKASYTNYNKPKLSDAWGRLTIGGHLPDARSFDGLLDEFFIYNWELDPSEVRFVLKYCADRPKLVSFTVRVPLFKRQRISKNKRPRASYA